jgi:alpha,alpha-trehalase
MIKEYKFWMKERSIKITHRCLEYKLNIYNPDNDLPRPESYCEDLHTAQHCTENERAKLFKDISAAAESGIDFSSRWFKDPMKMETIQTTDIIPVDLNALLYKVETIIAKLSQEKGDLASFKKFQNKSFRRKMAINNLMWSNTLVCWADYNYKTKTLNEQNFYISCLSPLYMDMKPRKHKIKDIIEKHIAVFNFSDCGMPYSIIESSQQWDYANIWAPNQHELIMMLLKYNKELALSIARKFVKTVYVGWLYNGIIYEKYCAKNLGERGGGGEYEVQSGFGWTNGTVISLINTFKDDLFD